MDHLHVPPADTRHTTRAAILSHSDEIRTSELEIEDIQSEVPSRADKVCDTAQTLPPVRHLPFDVVAEIVVTAAIDRSNGVYTLRTLLSLCRMWRDATLRTPRAWTNITYVRDADGEAARAALVSMRDVRLWFSRGAACPVDARFETDGTSAAVQDDIFVLLHTHASRLRSLTITNQCDAPKAAPELVLKALATAMPLLEHFGMSAQVKRLDESAHGSILPHVPRLFSLALDSPLDYVPSAVLAQLRHLRIHYAFLPTILNELGRYPQLQSLRITSLNPTVRTAVVPIDLDGLRVLYLALSGPDCGPAFMQAITAPRLEQLAIRLRQCSLRSMRPKEASSMLGVIFDINPPLRRLHLQRIPLCDADLYQALCHVPRLEVLVLLQTGSSDQLCDALAARQHDDEWICPLLARLCIGNSGHTDGGEDRVSRAGMHNLAQVRSHAGGVAGLQHLRLDQSELRRVGTAWEWDSEEREDEDYASDSDGTESMENRVDDSIFASHSYPCVPLWWQVDVGPYENVAIDTR